MDRLESREKLDKVRGLESRKYIWVNQYGDTLG